MFAHSEKVPQLYKKACKCLKEIIENGASLKQLVYNQKHPNSKAIFALLTKTLQHYSEINHMIIKSNLLENEPQFDPWLARILITQLFWSNNGLAGTCKPIVKILSNRAALENHRFSSNNARTIPKVIKPRYVRVNTLAVTVEEAVDNFCYEGWELVQNTAKTYEDYITRVAALKDSEFMIDAHIKQLFLFPPKTEFHNSVAYKSNLIMLQDKASCLSVQLLNPPPGSVVLDMCAAPGMKTTFIAACLNNQGKVYAVESNPKRYDTLNAIVEKSYATCIETINSDVLLVTPNECPNVEYILVDPSCSGSGIVDRFTIDDKIEEANELRLKKLSYMQMLLLRHALNDFPQVKRVVYSTCSIYTEENEGVVEEALQGNANFKLVKAAKLLNYPFRKSKKLGDQFDHIRRLCIRVTPEEDLTTGFFIAVFERVNEQDVNESLNELNVTQEIENSQLNKIKRKKREIQTNDSAKKKQKSEHREIQKLENSLQLNRDASEVRAAEVQTDEFPIKKIKQKEKERSTEETQVNDSTEKKKKTKHVKQELENVDQFVKHSKSKRNSDKVSKCKKNTKSSEFNNIEESPKQNECNLDCIESPHKKCKESQIDIKTKAKKAKTKITAEDQLVATDDLDILIKRKSKKKKSLEK